MIGEYRCPYKYYSGKICNKPCIRPEGCRLHWKKEKRPLCKKCDKSTVSESGLCSEHIGGYYVVKYYKKLRTIAEGKS